MKVILFDGVCNLCNGLVNWVIDRDTNNVFRFSALQSNYGKSMIQKYNIQGNYMDTIVLLDDETVLLRSDAVLRILKYIGGIYSVAGVFMLIPVFIRDFVYKIVAKNRYRWFGKMNSCRVPTPELKAKFLE